MRKGSNQKLLEGDKYTTYIKGITKKYVEIAWSKKFSRVVKVSTINLEVYISVQMRL